MLELFLIAQCSLTLFDGSTQHCEFYRNTLTSIISLSTSQNLPSPDSCQPPCVESLSSKSNSPISYRYLTKNNYERWKALTKNFDPISGNSQATLNDANSLFGSGEIIQTKGAEMQKIKWEESDRSVEAWFKKENNLWVLVTWKGKGF